MEKGSILEANLNRLAVGPILDDVDGATPSDCFVKVEPDRGGLFLEGVSWR